MSRALALGLAILCGALALYAVVVALSDPAQGLDDPADFVGVHPMVRMNVVLALIIAFTASAGLFEAAAGQRDLRDLHPRLRCSEEEYAQLERALGRTGSVASGIVLSIGGGLGAAIQILASDDPWAPLGDRHRVVQLLLMVVLFALLAKRAHDSVVQSRLFSEIGLRHVAVRLFDPEPLAVFGRRGLRLSINWLVGSAIASLLFIDAGNPGVVGGVLVATLGLAVLSLLLPARGIHLRLREAKRAELVRVREAIEQSGAALFEPGEDGEAGADGPATHLPALIAYEGRVEAVREWPFDTPTLVRFGALALLATGSWLGGALVERLLGLALG